MDDVLICRECKKKCQYKYLVTQVNKISCLCSAVCLSHWADNEVAESNYDPKTRTEILYTEYGCSHPISFNTSEGRKTMLPGKRYNENLDEIKGE